MNKIIIRDTIKNELRISCFNLKLYDKNNKYYSFDCYIINDISKQFINITLSEEPMNSDIITIEYSLDFKNKTIILNYHCSSDNILNSKYKRFYRKFNSTLKLLQPYVNNLILDELNINIFSFKIYSKIDKNPNNKLYDYFNKYLTDGYLFLPIENPT